uniref:Uncharacterized protein n=1 Tax=Salix viminalis TaxID=40686 RepID=A0A6N2LJZ7_SALVM
MPVSSLLKNSNIVHVGYVNEFTLSLSRRTSKGKNMRKHSLFAKFIDFPSRKQLVSQHLQCLFVDHNTRSCFPVRKSWCYFIYYPGLAGDEAILNPDVEEFDPSMEMKGLISLGSGTEISVWFVQKRAICFIDELFLSCSDQDDEKGRVKGDCMDLFKSLEALAMDDERSHSALHDVREDATLCMCPCLL